MANMTGQFPGLTFQNIVGYRISAFFTPAQGFQSFFFVYIWEQMEAASAFPEQVNVGSKGKPSVGTLSFKNDTRVYTFNNINLESAQVGVTRRNRYRLLEFRYDKANLATATSPVSLQNSDPDRLIESGLGNDYEYSLGGETEQLLGFRARMATGQVNILRFSSLRNNVNCFLQQIISASNQSEGQQSMSAFTINFTPKSIQVTQQNLAKVFIQESYGYLQHVALPPLLDYTAGTDTAKDEGLTRMLIEDYRQSDLLALDANMNPTPFSLGPRTVETATFVFNQGNYQDLNIT